VKNGLWDKLQKELSVFSDNKNECPNDTLYHYTSLFGLESILKTKTLWMGQRCQTNKKSIGHLLHKYQFNNVCIKQYKG
jgi:hypothetical protein